ncbi:hypothetical protein DKM44_14730 [Deinococcus irradiatisoli]|uniref:Uncharacterized protein n=1 Tax=Deinococcus irradiatisoli TaxID=2202254 RepID=A0A2Z3JGP1_9DEIO|nr:hypothetical protein DKM44_14730 [Deinococcus irradiatisoli]
MTFSPFEERGCHRQSHIAVCDLFPQFAGNLPLQLGLWFPVDSCVDSGFYLVFFLFWQLELLQEIGPNTSRLFNDP